MGMPVKLSDELVDSARAEAANSDRSITGQIEHWAKIGRSVEAVLGHNEIQALKRSPQSPALSTVTHRAIQVALERVVSETDRSLLSRRVRAGRTVYQIDPSGSGLTERIEPNGTRTLGRFANRRFVPVPPSRSRLHS
jgi:hypothetical protein